MDARKRFREGWIMLQRPFEFGNLDEPIQKMTMVYAYAETPKTKDVLTDKGKALLDDYDENYGKTEGFSTGRSEFRKFFSETDKDYEWRMNIKLEYIFNHYTEEKYLGEVVQAWIKGQMCRFFPGEYSISKLENLQAYVDEELYYMETSDRSVFGVKEIKDKIFYLQSRGLERERALELVGTGLKDAVFFRPKMQLLEMFCRDHEIIGKEVAMSEEEQKFRNWQAFCNTIAENYG